MREGRARGDRIELRERFRPGGPPEGWTLVGNAKLTDPGLVLDGSGDYAKRNYSAALSADEFWVRLVLTPDRAIDATDEVLVDVANGFKLTKNAATSAIDLEAGGTAIGSTSSLAALWQVGTEVAILVSCKTGDCSIWVGESLVLDSDATAFTALRGGEVVLGADSAYANAFDGTIRELTFGFGQLSDAEAADWYGVRVGTEAVELRPEKSRLYLPMLRQFGAGTAGDPWKTPNLGSLGSACDALLGADGQTAASKPTLLSPRGFSLDGGDWFTVPDSDGLSFVTGGVDQPFSVAIAYRVTAGLHHLFTKGLYGTQGEYFCYENGGELYFCKVDQSASAYVGRKIQAMSVYDGLDVILVATSDGTTGDSHAKIYVNGLQADDANGGFLQGSYVAMEPAAQNLTIGSYGANVMTGKVYAFAMVPRCLTARQVRRLTAEWRQRLKVAA